LLDAEHDDHGVSIVVSDKGGWREPRESDRGRGLDLMRALMDEVELEAGDDGTTVRMRRRLGVPSRNGAIGRGRRGRLSACAHATRFASKRWRGALVP